MTVGIMLFIPGIFIGAIVLQVILSKSENRWAGLILPALFFIGSLFVIISDIIYINTVLYSTTVDGETTLQTLAQMGRASANIGRYIYVFILYNIPTVIFLAIYFARRSKLNRQRALEKMSVQDL